MIRIGTSGWQYQDWKDKFYPQGLPDNQKLAYYSKQFDTVEVNNTFYRLPRNDIAVEWKNNVPEDFLFSIKANRYITHMKKLKHSEEPIENLLEFSDYLGKKLGPILFQLPGNWNADIDRLSNFLNILPKNRRYAFEFRNKSWYKEEVFSLLIRNGISLVLHDMSGSETPDVVTADFVYVRLHGPAEEKYRGSYTDKHLEKWSRKILLWKEESDVFLYFNNDYDGNAINNARTLIEINADHQIGRQFLR